MSRWVRIVKATGLLLGVLAWPGLDLRAAYIFTSFDGPGTITATTANGINNDTAIVGFSTVTGMNFNFIRHPNNTFTLLVIGGDTGAMANGINKAGTVVGVSGPNNATHPNTAFSLASGSSTPTFLPAPNPGNTVSSVAFGINDKGVIVGQYVDSKSGTTPGFILNNGAFTLLNPTDPVSGTTATVTNAQGINNNGTGVGFESANGVNQHGFKFDLAGHTTALPDPAGTPQILADGLVLTQFLGVNDSGIAVGYYQTNGGSQHGFLFDLATDKYTFLDEPNSVPGTTAASITQITGIDNAGDLTGFYLDANGAMHGFLATPAAEPAPLTLLGIGLAGLAVFGWRRKTTA
jgi:hypothetical protein